MSKNLFNDKLSLIENYNRIKSSYDKRACELFEREMVTLDFENSDDAAEFKTDRGEYYQNQWRRTESRKSRSLNGANAADPAESVLQEGRKIKAAVLGALMAFTGISTASARGLKSTDDYSKDLTKVKLELISDYGRAGAIPKEDLQKMVQACSEAEGLTAEQSQEALVSLLGQMGRQNDARAMSKLNLAESKSRKPGSLNEAYISVMDLLSGMGLAKLDNPFGAKVARPGKDFYNYTRNKGWFGGIGWDTPCDSDELKQDWTNWVNSLIKVGTNKGDWEDVEIGATTLYLEDKDGVGCMAWDEGKGFEIFDLYGFPIGKADTIESAKTTMINWYFREYTKDDYRWPLTENRLTEAVKLEEANLLKKAIVSLGILASLGVGTLNAQALKDKDDWNKSWDKCAKELTAEYGKDGEIPKEDYKKMIDALKKSNAEDVVQEWEDTNGHPVHWFMDYAGCKANVDSVLEDMGFTVARK